MKYIKQIVAIALSSLALVSCKDETVKMCTYYNKPVPTQVSFVGYYDYELRYINVFHLNKADHSDTLKVDNLYFSEMPTMRQDTSQFMFALTEKADYIIEVPSTQDTITVNELSYEDSYFEKPAEDGKCESKNYDQMPSHSKVNKVLVPISGDANNVPVLYLKK